ncbi:MAG: hypothetical protein L3J33_01345 [Rhodobacteraceae bacterium]|nr:hypothetical protein [Paracoccaceae bacterium]
MSLKTWVFTLIVALGLSGCVRTNTIFPDPLREDLTYNWQIVSVEANVSRDLTTTDINGQMPDVDIIWREDGPGDVYLQVQAIMEETMTQAISGMQTSVKGSRKVILISDLVQFHSLTERARSNIGGIHNIDFTLTVVDATTREVLAGPAYIESDVTAFGGAEAAAAVARGETMRVRIIQRVSDVIATYLGIAGDRAVQSGSIVEIGR